MFDRWIKLFHLATVNHIPPVISKDAHVKTIKHTGLVRNILWIEIFVWCTSSVQQLTAVTAAFANLS